MPQPIDILAMRDALEANYVLLLTTNSVERDAVSQVIAESFQTVVHRDTRGSRIGRLDDRFCIHLNGAAGAQDNNSIGSLTRWMTSPPRPVPQLIIVVGFAWGNPAHCREGDVIVASRVRDVNHVRFSQGIVERRDISRTSPLGSVAECVDRLKIGRGEGRVLSGEFASAEAYLSDTAARDAILKQFPDLVGGEMEAFDVVRELDVPWLFIKAVSDDGGDDVDRRQQHSAARNAASLILPALQVMTTEGLIEQPRKDKSTERLADALIGHAFRISRPAGARGIVVEAMNREVPRIMQRLASYGLGVADQELLAEVLAVAMAEVGQNAFIHGDASYINLSFNETSVSLSDDGFSHDPNSLMGDRGGATAWCDLDRRFFRNGDILFKRRGSKARGNNYRFTFAAINSEIRNAERHCSVRYGFRGSSPFEMLSLIFEPSCQTLFYDASKTFTVSKRFGDASELISLLEGGRSLIIACRDERQAQAFEVSLAAFAGPRLRIFVGSRL